MPNYSISTDGRSEPIRFGSERANANGKLCSAADTIKSAYRQVLKRDADFPGCEPHIRALEGGGQTVRGVVRDLLRSEEWRSRFIDGCDGPEIVLALYSCALARAPDRASWNDFMATGARDGWDTLIDQFVNSSEYTERFGDDTVPGQDCQYSSSSPVSAT